MEIIELERWKSSETDPRRPRGETPALADHWAEMRQVTEPEQETGGMTLG